MKKAIITISILAVIAIGWLAISNRYTNALMSMCADTQTKTLYDCN